ncbi:hypothetical protein KEM52_000036 [Ascosphaera acerosa]|nr:hypothetical protein KEM52_000036 [Ascosphaera acerosa]
MHDPAVLRATTNARPGAARQRSPPPPGRCRSGTSAGACEIYQDGTLYSPAGLEWVKLTSQWLDLGGGACAHRSRGGETRDATPANSVLLSVREADGNGGSIAISPPEQGPRPRAASHSAASTQASAQPMQRRVDYGKASRTWHAGDIPGLVQCSPPLDSLSRLCQYHAQAAPSSSPDEPREAAGEAHAQHQRYEQAQVVCEPRRDDGETEYGADGGGLGLEHGLELTRTTTEEDLTAATAEYYETFSSLEPPMTYNRNKPRLFVAVFHRGAFSRRTARQVLGVNAFRWAFLYASKDFRNCFKIYAPSPFDGAAATPPLPSFPRAGQHQHQPQLPRSPPPSQPSTLALLHEPIYPQEIIAEPLSGIPADEAFLGLVLLSKVSVDVPLERIIDEILKVRLATVSPISGREVAHTPASWLWAAVKRLRRMSRALVPNAPEDLEARALRFADKRMRAVRVAAPAAAAAAAAAELGSRGAAAVVARAVVATASAVTAVAATATRTHWILNITDLGKPVACPADLGDTWQKVITRLFGEATTVRVQHKMRQLGLTKKLR